MKLVCKTENDSNPNGKQKVYFAAHLEDYGLLDEISRSILNLQDCAIYYDTEPQAEYEKEELYEHLEQMQLMVFPITEKFLREKNRAFEVEFPYAIKAHIPVLPLMQKKGLENSLQEDADYFKNLANEFNQKLEERFPDDSDEKRDRYRNLQILNPYDSDPTTIPFEDKLKKFLSSVLVNDELAAKIREAFDAYIFLSYRKKDRAYANKLIRLIHENEFCQNIAIWFDEFLLPGENFSTAIEAAMKKSSLFALTITPNVLEEKNFVKDEEYPRAREVTDKVIFPVVLAPLAEEEERQLLEKFPGIPERVNAVGNMDENGKGACFTKALLQAVQRAGIQFGEGSPAHNFLIGMAYMNGIDMEKDVRRALELIQGAAEDGLPEALSKLVDLYSTGNGVALDYREAAKWQEKEVSQLKKEFAENESPETADKLVSALAALGEYRYGVRDLDGASMAYEELKGVLEKFRELSPENKAPMKYLANYFFETAKILYSKGRFDQAEQYLQKCWVIATTLCDGGLELGVLEILGHIHRKQGKLDAAEEEYREVYSAAEEMYQAESRDRVRQRALISSCNQMGRICQEQGHWQDAEGYYSRMLELCLQLAEKENTPKSRVDLALAYAKMGDASRMLNQNHLEDARQYTQKAQKLYRDLYEQYGTMEVKRGLAITYERLGDLCMEENMPGEAKKFFEKYFALSNELYKEGLTMRSEQEIRNLMLSSSKMGNANYAQNDLEEAYKYYKLSLEKAHELCGQSEDLYDTTENLPLMYEKLGTTCYRLNRLAEAALYLQNALKLRQNAPSTPWQKEDWGIKRRIALDCKKLVTVYEDMGDEPNTIKYCLEGLPVSAELYNTYRTEEDARYFLTFAQRLGVFAYLSDKLEPAFQYLQDVVMVRNHLNDQDGTIQVRKEFSKNYEFLGHIYYRIHNFQHAAECYKKNLDLHLGIAQEYPSAENYGDCAWGYYYLSTALDDAGEYNCLQNAAGVIRNILDYYPESAPKYKDLYLQCLLRLKRFQQ